MAISLQSIDDRILRSITAKRSPAVFSAKDFAGLGRTPAISQALGRLVKAGKLRRVRQGLYDLPRSHPIIGETAPDPMAVIRALMAGSSAQWQVAGAYAANVLGLSDQVPAKIVVLTNGVPRRVQLGKLTLIFRRASPRNLLGAGRPAGMVLQALRTFRQGGVPSSAIDQLRRQLDPPTKADLVALAPDLPAWMRPIIDQIASAPVP